MDSWLRESYICVSTEPPRTYIASFQVVIFFFAGARAEEITVGTVEGVLCSI